MIPFPAPASQPERADGAMLARAINLAAHAPSPAATSSPTTARPDRAALGLAARTAYFHGNAMPESPLSEDWCRAAEAVARAVLAGLVARGKLARTAPCPACGGTDDPGEVICPSTGCLTRCETCDGAGVVEPHAWCEGCARPIHDDDVYAYGGEDGIYLCESCSADATPEPFSPAPEKGPTSDTLPLATPEPGNPAPPTLTGEIRAWDRAADEDLAAAFSTIESQPLATPAQEALAEVARKDLPPAAEVFGEQIHCNSAAGERWHCPSPLGLCSMTGLPCKGHFVPPAVRAPAPDVPSLAELRDIMGNTAFDVGRCASANEAEKMDALLSSYAALLDIADAALAWCDSCAVSRPGYIVLMDRLRAALARVRP